MTEPRDDETTSRELVRRAFAEGFRRVPEDEDELAEAHRLAVEAIGEEPWDADSLGSE